MFEEVFFIKGCIASSHEPLTGEGKADIQSKVDYLYSVFVDAVARNRGTSSSRVLSSMADGRVFLGKQAVKVGLVDGVSTMTKIITNMQSKAKSTTMQRAAVAQTPTIHPAISSRAFATILMMKGIAPPRDAAAERAATQATERAEHKKVVASIAQGGSAGIPCVGACQGNGSRGKQGSQTT